MRGAQHTCTAGAKTFLCLAAERGDAYVTTDLTLDVQVFGRSQVVARVVRMKLIWAAIAHLLRLRTSLPKTSIEGEDNLILDHPYFCPDANARYARSTRTTSETHLNILRAHKFTVRVGLCAIPLV